MRKLKIFLVAACLLMTVGAQPAFAANTWFGFDFYGVNQIKASDYGTKDDNDSRWFLSLDRSGNNMSSSNIFGVKIHRTYADYVGSYATFSNYVSSYPLEYESSVYTGDQMYLKGQKDDASTSSASLSISGRFCP